jgi:hypothetical protein
VMGLAGADGREKRWGMAGMMRATERRACLCDAAAASAETGAMVKSDGSGVGDSSSSSEGELRARPVKGEERGDRAGGTGVRERTVFAV